MFGFSFGNEEDSARVTDGYPVLRKLIGLAVHLGGGSSILRIGGSDQNDFYYDMNSTQAQTFSAKTGGPCCEHTGSCSSCTHDCTMPAPYWKRIADFAAASKHRLVFGLVPDLPNATGLIVYVQFRQHFLILATLSWMCVGIRRRRALPFPVCS